MQVGDGAPGIFCVASCHPKAWADHVVLNLEGSTVNPGVGHLQRKLSWLIHAQRRVQKLHTRDSHLTHVGRGPPRPLPGAYGSGCS